MTSPITTHVLDTARGCAAAGVGVLLDREEATGEWARLGSGVTDADGRLRTLLPAGPLLPGAYRLTFDAAAYFEACGTRAAFWRAVTVEFLVKDPGGHLHVPLLLSPFGYSTYRGT